MYTEKEEIIITTIRNEVLNANSICHRYLFPLPPRNCSDVEQHIAPSQPAVFTGPVIQRDLFGQTAAAGQTPYHTHTLPVLYCNTPFNSKITIDKIWTEEQKQALGKLEDTVKFCFWLASAYTFIFFFTLTQTLLLHIRPQLELISLWNFLQF